jgi:hypothetical protein
MKQLGALLFPSAKDAHYNAFKKHFGVDDADYLGAQLKIETKLKELPEDKYRMNQRHFFAALFEFLVDDSNSAVMNKVINEFLQSTLGGRILSTMASTDTRNNSYAAAYSETHQ